MTRLSLALTFDFDGLAPILNTDRDVTWLSHAEFGARVGAPRILDALKERGLRSTWFIPGHTVKTFPGICERIASEGHEIAHHGFWHEAPSELDEPEERRMLELGIEAIESLTGSPPEGYRAPYWRSGPGTQELLVEYGFQYDSSLMGDDFRAYPIRIGDHGHDTAANEPYHFGRTSSLIEVPVAWNREDGSHYEIHSPSDAHNPQHTPSQVVENWESDLLYAWEHVPDGVATMTMHPEVTGRGGRLVAITALIDRWLAKPDVRFVRLDEYVCEYRSGSGEGERLSAATDVAKDLGGRDA